MSGQDAIKHKDGSQNEASMSLNDRMLNATRELTYRRITSSEDFELVGELRRREYESSETYNYSFENILLDDEDFRPETFVFGVYSDSKLVASIRLNKLYSGFRNTITNQVFGDVLNPLIDQGLAFTDPSRFVVDSQAARVFPGLPFITLRLAVIATDQFDAQYCLALVRDGHVGYYRKVFLSTMLAPLRKTHHIKMPIALLAGDRQSFPKIYDRYPIFHFTQTERKLLFEEAHRATGTLAVTPTALIAMNAA